MISLPRTRPTILTNSTRFYVSQAYRKSMGKNKKQSTLTEDNLLLPLHTSLEAVNSTSIVDTHTHLVSTFEQYQTKYKPGKFETVYDFVRGLYADRKVESIVDVWCEAPVNKIWKELAESAANKDERWGGLEYWFVMGVHPHQARLYTDEVEQDILEAMSHPRCVGWGEIGLDYHYDNSPREIQKNVLARQIRQAVKLGKPLTIHTREAEEDTERILKQEVPKEHKIHIHCFTDSPEFAQRLLDHFPNLYIGITGVITYSTNLNTSALIRQMASTHTLRILLETDAPYMVPSNIYTSITSLQSKKKLPLCHTAMIPWTAEYVAGVANSVENQEGSELEWNTEKVMHIARENAKSVYGV